jgi:hypothetical protein
MITADRYIRASKKNISLYAKVFTIFWRPSSPNLQYNNIFTPHCSLQVKSENVVYLKVHMDEIFIVCF